MPFIVISAWWTYKKALRTHGVVRHVGKREKLPLLVLLGLDQLPRLPWVRHLVGSKRRELSEDTRSVDAQRE